MMGRFEFGRRGSRSMPEFDGFDVFPVRGTGNGVCGCCCEDTGNGVCGSSRERRASSLRGAVSMRGWETGAPVDPGIVAVAALYGSWHWKRGVSGSQYVPVRSRVLLRTCSGNVGGELA